VECGAECESQAKKVAGAREGGGSASGMDECESENVFLVAGVQISTSRCSEQRTLLCLSRTERERIAGWSLRVLAEPQQAVG
jgi:hypothetical protein